MNMVEKRMLNLGSFSNTINQQSQNQPTKSTPPKAKGAKPNWNGHSTSYSMEQSGEDKCWRCGGPHKKDGPNPPQATTSNPNPN